MRIATAVLSFLSLCGKTLALVDDLPFPTPSKIFPTLSLDDFNAIMMTEAKVEFGVRRLSSNEYNELWNSAMDHQWSVAVEREESAHSDRRRGSEGRFAGDSPFLVCDEYYGENGEQCMENIKSFLGEKMTPVYNKVDRTCVVLSTRPSKIIKLPAGFTATPMTADMKIQEGVYDRISTGTKIPGRFQAKFCDGKAEAYEQGLALASEIFEHMREEYGRGRRTKESLRAPGHRKRDLKDENDSDSCGEMLDAFELQVSVTGDIMSLNIALGARREAWRDCLRKMTMDVAAYPDVCFFEVDEDPELLNTLASDIVQGGPERATPFYDAGIDGTGQVVALADTGLDTDNCYFWDSSNTVPKDLSGDFDPSARKVIQYYAYRDDKDVEDGHGTHVAGTIAGRRALTGSRESDGLVDGIAKGAKLAFFDIFATGDDTLSTPEPNVLFAPGYRAGARIHSASWGSGGNTYSSQVFDYDRYLYDNPDFLFVVAVGNSGNDHQRGSVLTPAVAKNCLTVGATQSRPPHIYDEMVGPDYLGYFSSRGPTSDGRIKPDIVAPGMFLRSASAQPDREGECDTTDPDGLRFNAGTSMSAPVVAGVAALVRQYFLEGRHENGSPSSSGFSPQASLIKAVLVNGGQELRGIQSEDFGLVDSEAYDIHQGFGRVDLLRSLPLAGENNISGKFVNGRVISNGRFDDYEVEIDQAGGCNEPFTVTLVWTDPPGGPGCRRCVLNNLDLSATMTRGGNRHGQNTVYYPNGLDSADDDNNVERIRIENPHDGEVYAIRVEAADLIRDQEYSLAITGCFNSASQLPTAGPTPRPTPEPASEPECVDDNGEVVMVGDGHTRRCEWLSGNLGNYRYLCGFLDVARACPVTCDICSFLTDRSNTDYLIDDQTVDAGFTGRLRWDGLMFNVRARTALSITGMDIHLNTESIRRVRIFTKLGSFVGYEKSSNGWTRICDITIIGMGYGIPTSIPASEFTPVAMSVGQVRSFYVTVDESDLIMTTGSQIGRAQLESGDLRIDEGIAVSQEFGQSFSAYAWNGRLHFSKTSASTQPCQDGSSTVLIHHAVGQRTCEWLSNNLARVPDACQYFDVAVHCPITCGACEALAI